MANETFSQNVNYELNQMQTELLEALLEPEDCLYPWNTADPESEAYFAEREWVLCWKIGLKTKLQREGKSFH
jgi:hypothetical protein